MTAEFAVYTHLPPPIHTGNGAVLLKGNLRVALFSRHLKGISMTTNTEAKATILRTLENKYPMADITANEIRLIGKYSRPVRILEMSEKLKAWIKNFDKTKVHPAPTLTLDFSNKTIDIR